MKARQKIRLGIVLVSFFLFPATFYYLSPYLIVEAATHGIVNGSCIFFLVLLATALVLGRGFCGWLCPGAGCQEALAHARGKPVTKGNYIKWILWVPWIGAVAFAAASAGGYREVRFFYRTTHGFSIGDFRGLIIYLGVLTLIFVPGLIVGRRSFCHHICWMAPFMIIGRSARNAVGLPALQLNADPGACKECSRCTNSCPMSLPVGSMVQSGRMENRECILCGSCADACKRKAIRFSFR
jgi:polyferredoxin